MHKRRGFTLLELVVTVAVLGVLAALLVVNSSTARLHSRDASRRESVSSYHTSFEQYAAAHSTYFVKSGTCTQTGTANQSGRPVYVQASGPGCTGIYGGGSGRITRRNSATNSTYSTLSIADGLVKEGYLSRIYTDPIDAKLSYTSHSDRDFVVTLCQADGQPALSPDTAKEFAIYTTLESDSPKEQTAATQLCGGTATKGGGWEYWLADASTVSPTRSFASVSSSASAANTTANPALALPKTLVNDVQAVYANDTRAITGNFTVHNTEATAVGSMYFTATLVGGAGTSEQQITDSTVTNLITLAPGEIRNFTYSLPVDNRLNTGTYYVVVRGWTQTGLPFAAQSKSVQISDLKDVFLDFNTSRASLYRDAEVVPPLAAATYTTSQKVTASLDIQNDHALNFVVYPRVQIYERAVLPGAAPVKTQKYAGQTVNGKSDQPIVLVFPTMASPESYIARVDLLDAAGSPISGFQEFRWVIAGESGKVLTSTVSGSQYLTHTVLNASATVVGPADGSEIAEAHLAMKVLDSSTKEVLYTDQVTVSKLNSSPRTLTFPADFKTGIRSLNSVIVQFALVGNAGTVLHETSATYNLDLSRANPPYYLVVPIILLLIALVAVMRRSHKTMHYMKPTALVVALLLVVASFSPRVLATAQQSQSVQTTEVAGCNTSPTAAGNPIQCQTLWDNTIYPQVQIIRNYDKSVVTINDNVTLTVQFSLDPANNGTLSADLVADHAVQDPQQDCVDAINYSDTNVVTGIWVKSVTAVSAGSTQVAVNVHSNPSTQCWQANSCTVDNTDTQVITCEDVNGGGGTPTPTGTALPSPTFTPSTTHFIGSGSRLF